MKAFYLALGLFISACAAANRAGDFLPVILDGETMEMVEGEAKKILAVTEKPETARLYTFYLSRFNGKPFLGLSIGNQRIYIHYELARRAKENVGYLWFLRRTLAHEIGHDMAGHAPNLQALSSVVSAGSTAAGIASHAPGVIGLAAGAVNLVIGLAGTAAAAVYGRSAEMEADRKGIEYWKKVGWDCRIWVRSFKFQFDKGMMGDFRHPIDERLYQSLELCLDKSDPERISIERKIKEAEEKRIEEQRRKSQEERDSLRD